MDQPQAKNRCKVCEDALGGGGDDWDGICPACADVVSKALDLLDLTNEDVPVLLDVVAQLVRRIRPWRRRLRVPTYYGAALAGASVASLAPEFGDPLVRVLVQRAEGVRLILGTHDANDHDKPDIAVERRPGGWAIFLHPLGGGDPSGLVYFLDDGRSFLAPERGMTPPLAVVDSVDDVPELDRVSRPW